MKNIFRLFIVSLPLFLVSCFFGLLNSSAQEAWKGVGWQETGFPKGDSVQPVNLVSTSKHLVAMTYDLKIYTTKLGEKKWKVFKPPFYHMSFAQYPHVPTMAAFGDKVFAIFSQVDLPGERISEQERLLQDSLLWEIDPAAGTMKVLPMPPRSMWCPDTLPFPYRCQAMAVYNWNGKLVLATKNGHPVTNRALLDSMISGKRTNIPSEVQYIDSMEVVNILISPDGGKTWEATSNYTEKWTTANRLHFKRIDNYPSEFTHDAYNLYSSTVLEGALKLSGNKWDSLPLMKSDMVHEQGFLILRDTLYTVDYRNDFGALPLRDPNPQWVRLPNAIAASFLDTACGQLLFSSYLMRWDPTQKKQLNILDSAMQGVRVDHSKIYPPGSRGYKLLRVGDSLYFSNANANFNGSVYVLNLREVPWCTDAWARRDTNLIHD